MDIRYILALKTALDHLQANRPVKAYEIATRVLEQDQENPEAWLISGVSLDAMGKPVQALDHLDRACKLSPESWDYLNHRAVVLHHLDRLDASRSDYEQSLRIHPDNPETLGNLGRLHMLRQRPDLAYPLFLQALTFASGDPCLHGDLGVCLVALRRPREGIASYRTGLSLDPNDPEIHFNLSRALLMVGDYEEGWNENEWRWQSRHYRPVPKTFPFPVWRGEPLNGQRILLIQEQGFGDAIQLIRYAPLIARSGAKVQVVCDKPLKRLFAAIPSVEQALAMEEPWPGADYCVPMFSLPKIFKTRLDSIPMETPYLRSPEFSVLPQNYTYKREHPSVGLIWRGKTRGKLTATDFKPLFDIQTISFVSLQKEIRPGELAGLPVENTEDFLTDFAATAALMSPLDLIISVDTASAHLAGALGKPVWILISYASEWRWLADGTTAPWYSSATLYRQRDPNSWADTIARLARDLAQWVSKTG